MDKSISEQKIKLYKTLQEYVKRINYPLSFSDDFHIYNHNKNFNCYAYAIGLRLMDNYPYLMDNGLSIYNPGTISTFKKISYDECNLIDAFLEDCNVLGIECKPTDIFDKTESETSKVAIYISSSDEDFERDFHFARLNDNDYWSNMEYNGGPVFCIGRGRENVCDIPRYNFLGAYTLRKKR